MQQADDPGIEARIRKDIGSFYSNLAKVSKEKAKEYAKIIEMAKMYASDSESYLAKKDFYTSFSCISYAHGLLDSVREMIGD
ncbi:MAG TPA: DUF357 domain-containing protein [Candidatus Acidoferrum sp.]|nr:DUF357 domain-containing protein [Candidatus Acidoferrum sp.]